VLMGARMSWMVRVLFADTKSCTRPACEAEIAAIRHRRIEVIFRAFPRVAEEIMASQVCRRIMECI